MDPQLLTALTTEHFALQGARSATISDSSSRASIFLTTVTGSLVALGFAGDGDDFVLFALVLLPAIALLGLITFIRVLESSLEDLLYMYAVDRIRQEYVALAGDRRDAFLLLTGATPSAVMADAGIWSGRRQMWFTTASTVAIVASLVSGACLAVVLVGALDLPLAAGVVAGVALAAALVLTAQRYEQRRFGALYARFGMDAPAPAPTASAAPPAPSRA